MKKQVIRLTEGDLNKIITESVKRILKEDYDNQSNVKDWVDMMLRCFRASKLSAANILRGADASLMDNQFISMNGVIVEYTIREIGTPNVYIDCVATPKANSNMNYDLIDYIDESVSKSNNYFDVDIDSETNANFIRFKLIPTNAY
jgi:hypothetical protein